MRTRRTADDVYQAIKDSILTGRLKPGNKISDRDLALELGVSRTPIRQALSQLAHDGLLDDTKGKGFHIADLDSKQVADLYALREVLEAHAVRLAGERATGADLNELAAVLATLESLSTDPAKRGEEIRVGLRVHEIIARASGDAFLCETIVRLLNRMHFFIWMDTVNEDSEGTERTRREHRDLIEFIKLRKIDEAEALIRRHVRMAREGILRVLAAREAFYQPPMREAPALPREINGTNEALLPQ